MQSYSRYFSFLSYVFVFVIISLCTFVYALAQIKPVQPVQLDVRSVEEVLQEKAETFSSDPVLQDEYQYRQQVIKLLKEQNEWLIRIYEK